MSRRRWHRRWGADPGGIALAAVGLVFLGLTASEIAEWRTLSRLSATGDRAEVKITHTESTLNRHNTEIFHYEFKPNDSDATITGEDRFSIGSYSPSGVPVMEYLKLRSVLLRVRYLSSDPTVNRLDIALAHRASRCRMWAFAMLLIAAACAIFGVRRCRR